MTTLYTRCSGGHSISSCPRTMAKTLHLCASLFKYPSQSPDKDRKYVEGNWGFYDASFGRLRLADAHMEDGHKEEEDTSDSCSVSSFSTNATTDNIPGPGRMLDKFYQHLGRKLERCILQFSISSLHPNRIMQCLWNDNFGWHYSDRDPLQVILGRIRGEKRQMGPVGGLEAIAGLESLVRQTQWIERGFMIVPRIKLFINHRSNSLYRSAAALTALMRLSTTSPSFGKFYFAISNSVPLFRLEARANALNVSKPDKPLFLSVVALGRARLPVKDRARLKSESVAHSLRKDLLRTLEYNQYVYSFNYIMVITQVS